MKMRVATDSAPSNPTGGLNKGFPLFTKIKIIAVLIIPCIAAGINKLPEWRSAWEK
jgi:hypothetical protein